MATYPGEELDIPKTLSESLRDQPLNFLVPKDVLSSLIDKQLVTSIPPTKDAFPSPTPEQISQVDDLTFLSSINEEAGELIFRRPENWSEKKTEDRTGHNLLQGLTTLANDFMNANNIMVKRDDIKKVAEVTVKASKHERITDGNSSLSLDPQGSTKRIKLTSGVSVNQTDIAEQFIKEFTMIVETLKKKREHNTEKFEYFTQLPDKTYILNENCLVKLQILVKNILSIKSIWSKVSKSDLKTILEILIQNLESLKESVLETGSSTDELFYKKIAYLATTLVFSIFQLDVNNNQLHMERYVLVPIDFINERIFTINNSDKSNSFTAEELSLLNQAISNIPKYIKQHPFIDEGLVTKLTYMFSELVMNYHFENSNIQFQHYWEEIKSTSLNIVLSLFQTVQSQRIFIIKDILTHTEKLPTKRVHRKLTKLGNGIYMTDFSILIMQMLESLQKGAFCHPNVEWTPESFKVYMNEYRENVQTVTSFIEHIHDTLLENFYQNPSSYRHVLENYIQDLLVVLTLPSWPISEELLNSIMKKLLLIFGPNSQKAALVETIALQLLGNIGSTIFEIKCSTKAEDNNNLIKIFNDSEELPKYMSKFHTCIDIEKLNSGIDIATNYLWNKYIYILIRLQEYGKNGESEEPEIPQLIKKELEDKNKNLLELKIYDDKKSINAYVSVLHSFELLNLYELYLKLVISLLGRDKIKLRSTAIKCLSMLVSRDQDILSSPTVKETIVSRLTDSSASVKDAILDLVSIGSAPITFHKQINFNFDDDSILVRKHVLKINEIIYDKTDSVDIKVFVASKILMRIEDEEDTIIDFAKQSLLKRWVIPISDSSLQNEKQMEACLEILSVMSGVAIINDKCTDLFEWFLNFYLLHKADHSDDLFQKITTSLNKLTDCLVHEIVELEAVDIEEEEIIRKKRNYLNLLSKFSDSVTTFITKDHIVALYPYMFTSTNSVLQFYLLCVFKDIIAKLDNFKPKFLYDLETVLLSRLPKMSVRETEEAMPLIWHISTKRKDFSRVSKACSSCLTYLVPFVNLARKSPKEIEVVSKLQRLIYLSTGFARFCDSKVVTEQITYLQDGEKLYEYVAKCLLVLSHKDIKHAIRRVAIKNLTKLCSGHPKLFNSKHILYLLDDEFKGVSMDIKLVLVESLYDFFIQEEKKSMRQVGVNRSTSTKLQLKSKLLIEKRVDSIHDGICSALVARFLKYILKLCLSEDMNYSLVALRLLRSILQYGYTNPSHCIPTIIGVLSSKDQFMRQVAAKTLNDLFEKYETMVFSGLYQGIKIAIEYSQIFQGSDFYNSDFFLKLLQDIIGSGKKNTDKYLKSVTKVLNSYTGAISHASSDAETRDAILFLSCNISKLSFTTYSDLLSLMKIVDFTSEQLRELIIDEIDDTPSNMTLEDNFKNCIIIEYSLRNLSHHLGELYNMKSDILLLDNNEEADLKTKVLMSPKEQVSDFSTVLNKMLKASTKKKFYINYLKTVEDEY